MKTNAMLLGAVLSAIACGAMAGPPSQNDRVYTADQSSNTVSVINPATNTLLGQIPLGNLRPDVLSALYRARSMYTALASRRITRP